MNRTRVLNAGIGLSDLDTRVVATDRGDASTQRAELRIVNGVKKVSLAGECLRPGVRLIDGLRCSSRRGNYTRVARVRDQQTVWTERDRGGKVRDLVGENLTSIRSQSDSAQLASRGKQQHPAVGGPDDRICALAVGNRTGLQL